MSSFSYQFDQRPGPLSDPSSPSTIDLSALQAGMEALIDWMLLSNVQDVQRYVDSIRAKNPGVRPRELAQKIVDEQSLYSGLLGAATGLGSLPLLPVTLPLDIIKSWKIQDFTIKSVAYSYGYTSQNSDLKTAFFLLMSNGSLEELKQFVVAEAASAMNEFAWNGIDSLKHSAIQAAAKEGPKYATKVLSYCGEKAIASSGMKEISKHLAEVVCKVGGKKIAEKVLEKSLNAAVPVLGAMIGGGVDWMTTQAAGRLAIEYFENSGPEFVSSVFNLPLPQRMVCSTDI